jgi:hypothetical protein
MTTSQIVLAIIAAAIAGLNLGFVAGCVWCDRARTTLKTGLEQNSENHHEI